MLNDLYPLLTEVVLTYMSIDGDLQHAVSRQLLHEFPMPFESDLERRALYLSQEVYELVFGPYNDAAHARRAGLLLGELESFVMGQTISLALTPRNHEYGVMGLLEPARQAVFDIRSLSPSPALRIFGRFYKTDVFVALIWRPRSKAVPWSDKLPLTDDQHWRDAVIECENRWWEILPNSNAITGMEAKKYVSTNIHLV